MKIYKITKYFRGGSDTYYAEMPEQAQMKSGGWGHQLDEWGEATSGGGGRGHPRRHDGPERGSKDRRMILTFHLRHVIVAALKI